jgi:SepF-like predicted cell division protein (DUF552 family)
MHEIEWPDLSRHPEYQKLDAQKQQMIDEATDEEEEDDEQTPKDLADLILANEGVEEYYREINGGAQVVLDHDFIADEYELSERRAKKVKKWLKKEVGGDVV